MFMHRNRTTIRRVTTVSLQHKDFIRENGDKHITQESFDYYAPGRNVRTDVLLECRDKAQNLLGIAFADCSLYYSAFSITVVSKAARHKGYGARLLRAKLREARKHSCTLAARVSQVNTESLRLCRKVLGHGLLRGDHYIFIGR